MGDVLYIILNEGKSKKDNEQWTQEIINLRTFTIIKFTTSDSNLPIRLHYAPELITAYVSHE